MKRTRTRWMAACVFGVLGLSLAGIQAHAAETVEAIPLNYIDAREAADVINALYGSEVRAVPFVPTNTLLVNLSPAGSAAPARARFPESGTFPRLSGPRPPMSAQPLPGGPTAPYAMPAPPVPTPAPQGPANPPTQNSEAPPTP